MSERRRHVAKERNRQGQNNFTHSLRSLFLQIQQLNTQNMNSEHLETIQSHLEDFIVLSHCNDTEINLSRGPASVKT